MPAESFILYTASHDYNIQMPFSGKHVYLCT